MRITGFALAGCFWLSEALLPEKLYSTNAICRQRNCINPVFPGLQHIESLQAAKWTCRPANETRHLLEFCAGAVHYDVAVLAASQGQNSSTAAMLKAQEDMASAAYFYHLAAMNVEAWDNQDPAHSDDECLKSVWKMVCNTYLPRAQALCKAGQSTAYQLPCQNVCGKYKEACAVECCDESVQCVPEAKGFTFSPPYQNFSGYAKHHGPHPLCTGSAHRSAGSPLPLALVLGLFAWMAPSCTGTSSPVRAECKIGSRGLSSTLLALILGMLALSLQGCDLMKLTGHAAGHWEKRPSYLLSYQMVQQSPKTGNAHTAEVAVLNSCEIPDLPKEQQCNGNGVCKQFGTSSGNIKPMSFCKCNRDWMDPECRTRRKSQTTAFMLSLFAGYFGLDRFYLGEVETGMAKLSTLGGCGLWWFWDVVRIGSSPVYASNGGRVAADLPHFMYVFLVVVWAASLSYLIFGLFGSIWHQHEALKKALLKAETDYHKARSVPIEIKSEVGQPTRASYHPMAPPPGAKSYYGTMAAASREVKLSAYNNPLASYYTYAKVAEQPQLMRSGAFALAAGQVPPNM